MIRSTLGSYLDAIGKHPLLTPAEEIHLARMVQAWINHPDGPDHAPPRIQRLGRRARDRMVTANLRLVVSIARRSPRSIHYNDDQLLERIQWGTLGLLHAVTKFDPERGYKFSTYGYWWIKQQIARGEGDNDIIRLPIHVRDEYRALERAVESIQTDGLPFSAALIAERSGLSENRVRDRLEIGRVRVMSLDQVVSGTDTPLGELISDPDDFDVFEAHDRQELIAQLHAAIDQLPEREAQLIRTVTLGDSTVKSFAAEQGLSRARVGQIKQSAVTHLRSLTTAA